MTQWVALSAERLAYCDAGRSVLKQLMPEPEVYEGPELQALFDWCLAQPWPDDPQMLEQYGPVLALSIGFGDCVVSRTGMLWGWASETGFDWEGPALSLPGTTIMSYPMPMMLQRLLAGDRIRIDKLIEDHVADIRSLAATSEFQVRNKS